MFLLSFSLHPFSVSSILLPEICNLVQKQIIYRCMRKLILALNGQRAGKENNNSESKGVFTIHLSIRGLAFLLMDFKRGTLGTFTGAVLCTVTGGLQDRILW